MPKSKSGRKKQRKRSGKRPNQAKQNAEHKAAQSSYQPPATALDDSLPIITALLPLAVAVFLSSAAGPEDMLRFSVTFTLMLTSMYLGASWLVVSDIDKGASILELKQSLDKGKVTSAHLRLAHLGRGWLLALSSLAAFSLTVIEIAAPLPLVLLGATALLGTGLRMLAISSPKQIILQAFALCLYCSALALIGVFSQTLELRHPLLLLGFAPGTVLAASLVPRFSEIFAKSGWSRSKPHTTKKGKEINRPGGSSNLYSGLLFLGPCTVFLLASAEIIPSWFMLAGVIFIFGPGLANAYKDKTISDQDLAHRTVWQAIILNLAMLVAGALLKF